MRFDLHIHSKFSFDSLSEINSLIKHAKKCGLSGIAITDHNVFNKKAIHCLQCKSFWLIPGCEMFTEYGDIIGLFIDTDLRSHSSLDLIDEIHDQGGIAILAHPFKRVHEYPDTLISSLDAIEIVNSRWVDLNKFQKNRKVAHLLSSVRGRSAGSDAHFRFEVGRAYLETPDINTFEELKKVICDGTGKACGTTFSSWLDEVSQLVILHKNFSLYQCCRILYRLCRRLFNPSPEKKLNV